VNQMAQSRRSFLLSAMAAGAAGRVASASPVQCIARHEREYEFEGWPATEFTVSVEGLGSLGAGGGTAVALRDPVSGEQLLAPLFDVSVLTEAKFLAGLTASARAHGGWHREQGQAPPAIHIHLIRVAGMPDLRALLIHARRCVLDPNAAPAAPAIRRGAADVPA
jgi:hypothetical protein